MLATTMPPKLYIPSTTYKHLKEAANWADKKWASIWQPKSFKALKSLLIAIKILILNF